MYSLELSNFCWVSLTCMPSNALSICWTNVFSYTGFHQESKWTWLCEDPLAGAPHFQGCFTQCPHVRIILCAGLSWISDGWPVLGAGGRAGPLGHTVDTWRKCTGVCLRQTACGWRGLQALPLCSLPLPLGFFLPVLSEFMPLTCWLPFSVSLPSSLSLHSFWVCCAQAVSSVLSVSLWNRTFSMCLSVCAFLSCGP